MMIIWWNDDLSVYVDQNYVQESCPFWKIRSHNYVKCNEIDLDSSTIKRIKNMENNDSTL